MEKARTGDLEIITNNSSIDNCLVILHNQYKNRISIHKQYEEAGLIVKGNSGKLHQVFTNILTNSIQAIEESGRISITTQKDEENVLILISDNGCGIKEENLSKIMDPFFTTKDPSKGTGLGLSITHSIISEHKGQLLFESEFGKGTTAKITLPINLLNYE